VPDSGCFGKIPTILAEFQSLWPPLSESGNNTRNVIFRRW
jgi:hypothetical protein